MDPILLHYFGSMDPILLHYFGSIDTILLHYFGSMDPILYLDSNILHDNQVSKKSEFEYN